MAKSTLTSIALLSFSSLAAYCIVGLQIRNGFFDLLDAATMEMPRKLPGSSDNMITRITGFHALDAHLGGLLVFFWPTISAESPSLSLFAFYMAGQVLSVQTLVLLEGLRVANSCKVISYTTIWGVLYQSVPWGIVMPIYFSIYLWTSPISQAASYKSYQASANSLSIDAKELVVLPIALTLGFIVPTILAAIPSPILTTLAQQQALLVFWQGFPIWIAIFQYSLTTIQATIRPSSSGAKSSHAVMVKLLRRVYIFSLSLTTLVHIVTIIFAILPNSRPAYFVLGSRPPVDLKTVFLPMSPLSATKVELLTQGCLILLQYDMYFACGAAVLWAAVIFHRGHPESSSLGSLMKALLLSLLVGPGGAALVLIWERDEKSFSAEKGADNKTGKAS